MVFGVKNVQTTILPPNTCSTTAYCMSKEGTLKQSWCMNLIFFNRGTLGPTTIFRKCNLTYCMYKWDCIASHGYIPSHLESIWRHLLFIQVSLKSYSAAQLLSVWVTADTLSSWVFSTCNNHTAKEVKGVAQGHTVSNCRWRSRSRCYINKHLKQMMKPDGINSQHPSGDTGGFITHFIPCDSTAQRWEHQMRTEIEAQIVELCD